MEENKSAAQAKALKEAQRQEREKERAEKKAQKEQAKSEREALKHDKELKKEQAEAEKQKKRQEREYKRQQEEAEKESKRQEKEASERKKNAVLRKQATILNRFLIKKDQGAVEASPPQPVVSSSDFPSSQYCVSAMDNELASDLNMDNNELLRKHLSSWKVVRPSEKFLLWGSRRAPKVELFKELRIREDSKMDVPCSSGQSSGKRHRRKLLQFHKCFRPAYYGTFSKKSKCIRPRRPLQKEPSLDYEVDSDEEWDQEIPEDPGETLSDFDDNEEEEKVDGDAESGDEFLVPDGYLSENEGIEMERGTTSADGLACPSTQDTDRLENVLKHVAERALKSNRAYIIQNFVPESTGENAAYRLRESCLQALSVQVLVSDFFIEPPNDDRNPQVVKPKTGVKRGRKSGLSLAESDLPEIVQVLQSTPQGMKKLVEQLSEKFPGVPKSRMELKIREISEYQDNRWKVKEEVLSLVQLPKKVTVSEDCSMRPHEDFDSSAEPKLPSTPGKTVPNFFQKRCLPHEENRMEVEATTKP